VAGWATRARDGGIWAPGGINTDRTSLFIATGNTIDATAWGDGEAVFRLPTDLRRADATQDFFAAADWYELDRRDADLGGTNRLPLDVPTENGTQALVLAATDVLNLRDIHDGLMLPQLSKMQTEVESAESSLRKDFANTRESVDATVASTIGIQGSVGAAEATWGVQLYLARRPGAPLLALGDARHRPSSSKLTWLPNLSARADGGNPQHIGDIQIYSPSVPSDSLAQNRLREQMVPVSLRPSCQRGHQCRELIRRGHSTESAVRSIAGIPGTGRHDSPDRVAVVDRSAPYAVR
jgi:hypothetical protein